jgi:plasmid stability protein
MATLMIRDLDDGLKARLRVQAAEHGRSMEAEARLLLAAALSGRRPSRGLGSYIRDQFAEIGGVDLEIPPRNEPARATDFSA